MLHIWPKPAQISQRGDEGVVAELVTARFCSAKANKSKNVLYETL